VKETQVAERTRRRAAGSSTRRGASQESGGRLNRDYAEEEYRTPEEGYDGPEPTKGLYTAELVRINDHTKKDEDEPSSVRWLFRLAKGSVNSDGEDVSGWMDSQYTTQNTAFREQQMLVATGVIKPNGKVNLPYDGIVKKAKACTVRVGVERVIDEEGEGTWRGRMQAFLPLRETTAERRGTKVSRDDDEDEEDVFDDETEADEAEGDEDDAEEAPPARGRRSTTRSRRKAAEPEPEDEDEEGDEDEDEDEEGDDEDIDPDTLAAELEDLSLVALKKRARDDFGVKITRGMKSEDIIEAVLDTLDEEPDDEDEDEEEPPPPPKRRTASKTAAKTGTTKRRRGSSEDPPF
jgi:hypothetical protein